MLYREHIRIIFPYSLLAISKDVELDVLDKACVSKMCSLGRQPMLAWNSPPG